MITHNLRVAVRNLLKYPTQSIISIVGLAIGLACFALSTLWVRHEMTFDAFHEDAERIYLVATDHETFGKRTKTYTPHALGEYLKNNYSEIEDYAIFQYQKYNIQKGRDLPEVPVIMPDSTFIRMMNIRILQGNDNFYRLNNEQTKEGAISEEMAIELFGTTDVIGREIVLSNQNKIPIGAVVNGWKGHSNFPYGLLMPSNKVEFPWDNINYTTLVKVKKGTDTEALVEKMNRNFPKELRSNLYVPDTGMTRFYLKALTELRTDEEYPINDSMVKSKYIKWFSVIGLLIIVCAMVNYLTIYADRLQTRRREMALRKVCGASEFSLLRLLAMEQLLIILLSFMLGMLFIEVLFPTFLQLSQIESSELSLYGGCMAFVGILSTVTFVVTTLSVGIIRRTSLHASLNGNKVSRFFFRRGSIILQLIICLSFVLVAVLMQMQLYHLRNVDTGIEYRNRGAVSLWMNEDMNVWYEKIKELPMIEEVVMPRYYPIVSMGVMMGCEIKSWDGQETPLEKSIFFDEIIAGEEFFRFYNIKLLAGEWITEKSKVREANITESTARRLGWTPEEAIGKHIRYSNPEVEPITVIGVVNDCAYRSPSADVPYTLFSNTYIAKYFWQRAFVLFKFKPGTWEECKKRIEEMHRKDAPTKKLFLFNEEEQYDEFLKSEDALSTLLGFASLVCILISVFGIYSLVTLTCEHRRKEIAIRKVNGAKMKDILHIFAKEYTLMLVLAAIVAFPITYIVMKQWIQTYNRQVEIGILPFLLILAGIALVIALSIGWRVWKAANENPADVVKSE